MSWAAQCNRLRSEQKGRLESGSQDSYSRNENRLLLPKMIVICKDGWKIPIAVD